MSDFVSGSLGGLGTGVGSGLRNLISSFFGGGKKRRRGGAAAADTPSLLSRINKVAKDSGIVSKALNEFGNPMGLGSMAGRLGYGRRRGRRGGAGYVRF